MYVYNMYDSRQYNRESDEMSDDAVMCRRKDMVIPPKSISAFTYHDCVSDRFNFIVNKIMDQLLTGRRARIVSINNTA
jgi:hypothetical protein